MHTLPNGDVLVVQSRAPEGKPLPRPKDVIRDWIMAMAKGGGGGPQKESNLITLLRDTNRDGKVDERNDLLTGLNSPFGVAWHDGTLYVAAADAILAYPYQLGRDGDHRGADGADAASRRADQPPLDQGSGAQPGRALSLCLGRLQLERRGARTRGREGPRRDLAGRPRRRAPPASYASGLRNPNGLTFHPETGVLWTVVNERDELGPNLVPDYLTSVQEGAFYGWPWSYFGNHVDERVHPPRPDMVQKAIKPDYALSSHVAALGLTFSMNSAMPEPYANGAFIGEHGSWNRNAFNGYKVVYVPFANGKPAGKAQDVVTGFLDGDQARGRPVGVAIDGTGALLIADDAGNAVWRVAATNAAAPQSQ